MKERREGVGAVLRWSATCLVSQKGFRKGELGILEEGNGVAGLRNILPHRLVLKRAIYALLGWVCGDFILTDLCLPAADLRQVGVQARKPGSSFAYPELLWYLTFPPLVPSQSPSTFKSLILRVLSSREPGKSNSCSLFLWTWLAMYSMCIYTT